VRRRGILTGLTLMPILPFIEDTEDNIRRIVTLAAENGAKYIIPALSMTLRDRQRAYYYAKLDQHFPGLRARYEKAFGERYSAPAQNARGLGRMLGELCEKYGIATRIPAFTPQPHIRQPKEQPRLF
jgi:DNA repair photolyase